MVHPDHDGCRVPNAVSVQVVGEISVVVAVNGRIHVVGVFDQEVEQTGRLLDDLVDTVLTGYGVFTALGKLFAVQ